MKGIMKKPVLFLLGILAVLPAACIRKGNTSGVIKIGVSVPEGKGGWTGGLDWWARRGAEEVRADTGAVLELRVLAAADTPAQILHVEDLVIWGMRYLVIYPGEPAALTPVIKTVRAQGIRIVVVDRDLEDTSFDYVHFAGNHTEIGRLSGQWLAREMKTTGLTNYIALGSFPSQDDRERMDAFFAEITREISLVNLSGKNRYEFARGDSREGRRLAEAYIRRYPRIDAIYCQDDEVLMGVLEAVKKSGRSDIKILFGGGGSRAVYGMIMEGNPLVRATVLYHPSIIAEAIRYTASAALQQTFPSSRTPVSVRIPPALIDSSNVHSYYEAQSPY
jgi:ribose transport system substrate-binding protein